MELRDRDACLDRCSGADEGLNNLHRPRRGITATAWIRGDGPRKLEQWMLVLFSQVGYDREESYYKFLIIDGNLMVIAMEV